MEQTDVHPDVTLTQDDLNTIRTALWGRVLEAGERERSIADSIAGRSYTSSAVALDYWKKERDKAEALFWRLAGRTP